jgi:arylsulfatase A-like enzyme
MIVRAPGVVSERRVDRALHYQYDWAATLIELAGVSVPDNWDGVPFTRAFREGREQGRQYLVVSQNAWSCQRSVRFGEYVCLRTYHDGYKQLDPVMLYDLSDDPHEQRNLAEARPQIVDQAMAKLSDWHHNMAVTATTDVDPMTTVLREGGALHTRGMLPPYLERLRQTGRERHAERLARLHPDEL